MPRIDPAIYAGLAKRFETVLDVRHAIDHRVITRTSRVPREHESVSRMTAVCGQPLTLEGGRNPVLCWRYGPGGLRITVYLIVHRDELFGLIAALDSVETLAIMADVRKGLFGVLPQGVGVDFVAVDVAGIGKNGWMHDLDGSPRDILWKASEGTHRLNARRESGEWGGWIRNRKTREILDTRVNRAQREYAHLLLSNRQQPIFVYSDHSMLAWQVSHALVSSNFVPGALMATMDMKLALRAGMHGGPARFDSVKGNLGLAQATGHASDAIDDDVDDQYECFSLAYGLSHLTGTEFSVIHGEPALVSVVPDSYDETVQNITLSQVRDTRIPQYEELLMLLDKAALIAQAMLRSPNGLTDSQLDDVAMTASFRSSTFRINIGDDVKDRKLPADEAWFLLYGAIPFALKHVGAARRTLECLGPTFREHSRKINVARNSCLDVYLAHADFVVNRPYQCADFHVDALWTGAANAIAGPEFQNERAMSFVAL